MHDAYTMWRQISDHAAKILAASNLLPNVYRLPWVQRDLTVGGRDSSLNHCSGWNWVVSRPHMPLSELMPSQMATWMTCLAFMQMSLSPVVETEK